jgi:pyruvate dehydrogenase E2 component (dihydrolipoamide acetyltransferase)
MKITVKMPRVAETVDEVVIAEWECAVGDDVAEGDVLLRVETDKAVVEVPSPVRGRVVELLVKPDDEVVTGAGIAVIDGS